MPKPLHKEKIHFIRHSESVANALVQKQRKLQDAGSELSEKELRVFLTADPFFDLTKKGARLAKRLNTLVEELITPHQTAGDMVTAIQSPYLRTVRTAALGFEILPLHWKEDSRIIERNWGNINALRSQKAPWRELQESGGQSYLDHDYPPFGGESVNECKARLRPFLEELLFEDPAPVAVVVGHGDVMYCLMQLLTGMTSDEYRTSPFNRPTPNCAIHTYTNAGDHWELSTSALSVNDYALRHQFPVLYPSR